MVRHNMHILLTNWLSFTECSTRERGIVISGRISLTLIDVLF